MKDLETVKARIREYKLEFKEVGHYLNKMDDAFRLKKKDEVVRLAKVSSDGGPQSEIIEFVIDNEADLQQEWLMAKSADVLNDLLLRQNLKVD